MTNAAQPTDVESSVKQEATKKPDSQSQGPGRFRGLAPAWFLEFPHFLRLPPAKPDYQFVPKEQLDELLKGFDAETVSRIKEDIEFMDYELMRLFRDRDRESALSQNRYRLYQIWYIILATLAGTFGGLQALFLNKDNAFVSFLAFIETLIALIATFLATISSREPPLPLWLDNRRRAEQMRREFYRYLLNLEPYDQLEGVKRKRELSRRAADINRGFYPDEPNA